MKCFNIWWSLLHLQLGRRRYTHRCSGIWNSVLRERAAKRVVSCLYDAWCCVPRARVRAAERVRARRQQRRQFRSMAISWKKCKKNRPTLYSALVGRWQKAEFAASVGIPEPGDAIENLQRKPRKRDRQKVRDIARRWRNGKLKILRRCLD